ncbi:MAG: fibronectin type III domain-containing protein [Prevotella sp.]
MRKYLYLLLPFVFIATQLGYAASPEEADGTGRRVNLRANNVKGRSMDISWNNVCKGADYVLIVTSENGCVTYDHLSDTVLTLTGLSPETRYNFQLRSLIDGDMATCNELSQTTTPLQFSELPCKALKPDKITHNSFVAHWDNIPNTEHYFVNVFERVLDSTATLSFGFPNEDAAMPVGWSSSSNSFCHDYYGESGVLSLRLPKDRDSLLITAQGDSLIKGVKFWWGGNRSGNSLSVRALDSDGNWNTIDNLKITEGKDSVANYSFAGVYAVCISFNRMVSGYACVDDVRLTVTSPHNHPVPSMTTLDAGKANSLTVSGLRPGVQYAYRVYATSGHQQTAVSNLITLQTLTDPTAIASVDASDIAGPVTFYDLSGRRVNYASAPSGVYIFRKNGKTYKVLKK